MGRRHLHGAVELVRILLVAVGRYGNGYKSGGRYLLHEWALDAASRVLDVDRNEGLELTLYLLFLNLLPYGLLGELFPLYLLYRQDFIFFLWLLLLFLHLSFSLQEVELPLVLLRLRDRIYLHFFRLFCYKLFFSQIFQVFHLLCRSFLLRLGLELLPKLHVLLILLEIRVFQYLCNFWPILSIDSEYLLDQLNFY